MTFKPFIISRMQLIATDEYYFVKSVKTILKVCRKTAQLSVTTHSELAILGDLRVYGDVFCCVGKIKIENVDYLLLVTECTGIAQLDHCDSTIYRIDKVCALPILRDGFVHNGLFVRNVNDGLAKLKNHPKKIVKFVSDKVSPNSKFIDDIVRFINESSNFYFSFLTDLTLSVQRRSEQLDAGSSNSDPRFFWNRALLKDFYSKDGLPINEFNDWIVPIIYGYVSQQSMLFEADTKASFTLISRRSVKRAGVRYLRRGIDMNGDVANFVETEFIIHVFGHCLSCVQIRGSVPIFWSQKGYRFRPPLSIDRTSNESFPIFQKHINALINEYGSLLVIVNLVEQRGRELCLGEAYLQHILELNSPDVVFTSFDFHQNCRSLRFHKVGDLVNILNKEISSIGFCWLDKKGVMVRQQKGVIRTNCVDCLDRTNVVQCAISQAVCLNQTRKLGLIEPGTDEFENTKLKYMETMIRIVQGMWADHGDSISKQYAGTNALKGDVTRGGHRRLMGFMKDGYNSASRYYLSQFHDAQRQRIIDALLRGSEHASKSVRFDLNSNSNITDMKKTAEDPSVSAIVDFEGQNEGGSSCWYDEDLLLTEYDDGDDDVEGEEGLVQVDLPIDPSNSKGILSNSGTSSEIRFDAESDPVTNDWVMVDAMKQLIADSKSKILIL